MASLNYHPLRNFWVIANEQNLPRAASRLHVSQSALSIQLRKLEESLGQSLFERENKPLALVPPVVVLDELRTGTLVERCPIPEISESFYAITPTRRFPNPIVGELVARTGTPEAEA